MYMMRIDQSRSLLMIVCSGRLSTAEALRAVRHAYALAEAGDIRTVTCDLTGVRRGPASLLSVAAEIAALHRESFRTAVVIGNRGAVHLQEVLDMTGLDLGVGIFDDTELARAWLLEPHEPNAPHIGATELRHFASSSGGSVSVAPRLERGRARKAGAA